MPATEKTWYDQKLLHVVFGISSLILLIVTIWMFAADHVREWKGYQRKFRSVEERLTSWRIDATESADYQAQLAALHTRLLRSRARAIPAAQYEAFKTAVINDAQRRKLTAESFGRTDEIAAELAAASDNAQRVQAQATSAQETADAAWEQVSQLDKSGEADEAAREAAAVAARAADAKALEARELAISATTDAETLRGRLIALMERSMTLARAREDDLLGRRKFRSADLDKSKGDLDILVRDARPDAEMEAKQAEINRIRSELEELTIQRQSATAHRIELDRILNSIRDAELEINKEIEDSEAQIARLEAKLDERDLSYVRKGWPGKKWLTIPILDAFNSPLKIDNLWTENLTITNGSFGKVRRFDRCTTCHRGIAKSAEGSADQPAYLAEQFVELELSTPNSAPRAEMSPRGKEKPPTLLSVYGIHLAAAGLVDRADVTVDYVEPTSFAATAGVIGQDAAIWTGPGLEVGDVILSVNGDKVSTLPDARQLLLDGVAWGASLRIAVRRGLPQPFTSHPRLDLFVGSLSPHPLSTFGCTSCHEGQGSATSFKWASHYPQDPKQMKEWARDHGWFNNHHWIYPMFPARFAESGCLKCHHHVTELEPSEQFPDPPAPKLVEGFHLIEDYGCYACHEINGYDGPDRRVGPDMRLEPNYYAAAAALQADPAFAQLSEWAVDEAETLVQHPEDDALRHKIRDLVLADAQSDSPQLTQQSHKMADVLGDLETPGTYRKRGPSLRYVAEKLGREFLYDWIRQPKHFRPTTKMPQFFGLWDHLKDDPEDLEISQRYERVEILGVVDYLLQRSQPFEYLAQEQVDAEPSAERGKLAFEIRGCLACHQHADFPGTTATQGPNLTGLGDKFAAGAKDAQSWLYSWVKQPNHYSPRTRMPDLFLDPYEDVEGNLVDPAADITEYLLSDSTGWKPYEDSTAALEIDTDDEREALDAMVLEYLQAGFSVTDSQSYLQQGIPPELAPTLKGPEIELVGGASVDQKLMYVGRKTLIKYGCYACHDIPGFEDAKPIGTAIADWGRKESSKLAFEHIAEYLHAGHGDDGHGTPSSAHGESPAEHAEEMASSHGPEAAPSSDTEGQAEPFDESFYLYQIAQLDRSGFIWQKLKEPRSYDYKKTHNKGYNERLRMPLFPLGPEQRESIITFVLGLVAEPPAEEFIYQGTPRRNAITEGWAVIQQFNCAGCHIFEPEQWDIEFTEGEFRSPQSPPDYPFIAAHLDKEKLDASAIPDPRRGVLNASIHGVPAIRNDDALQEVLDRESDPLDPEDMEYYAPDDPRYDPEEDPSPFQYPFELWQAAAIAGSAYDVGVMRLTIPEGLIKLQRPSIGGDLTKLLLPRVLELEKQENPSANGSEAWGWLAPPLVGEGQKVQPDWLYDFLIDPYPIRPAVFLRMPKFNLTPEEARKIVNYFAAKDNAEYPFEYSSRTRMAHLDELQRQFEREHPTGETRFDHAMRIVTNSNYCIKCHLIGEFAPEGSVRALAPDLSMVQHRLRPEYVRKWIAKPTSILPYTNMPVNIPFSEGVSQELYPGSSTEQVDALVDLLMNYGYYTSAQTDVGALIEAAGEANATPSDADAASSSTSGIPSVALFEND